MALSDTLGLHTMRSCPRLIPRMGVSSLWMVLAGPERLLTAIRSQKKIALATATSGVVASIMPGGRTAHPRFKIPFTIDNGAFCTFMKQSGTTKLLRASSLIIWDKASMTEAGCQGAR